MAMASSLEENWLVSDDESNERISLHLCKVLDRMGYSDRMIQYRRQAYQEYAAILNEEMGKNWITLIISGSKGEGLTAPFESDIDMLYLFKHVVCTEDAYVHQAPSNSTIFTFRSDYEQPGYSILTLHSLGPIYPESILPSLIPSPTGHQILSSDKHAEYISAKERQTAMRGKKVLGRSGPASTSLLHHIEQDRVYSIPSISPSVLQRWSQRPRHHDWPPVALIDCIANMRGNFVAKGCARSLLEEHEWRQCFNEAELLLVHSFDETLTKLYVLLKIITKEILRPLDTDESLTSYVMKNIVFWLAERNPAESFQPKYLIKWLIRALRMLKQSLKKVAVPYYMIPERNLLHPGMKERVNKRLTKRVQSLIKQGPRMLYWCEKLEFTTRMTHAELSEFGDKRDELEMLFLSMNNYHASLLVQGFSDEQLANDETSDDMLGRILELINSKWPPHIEQHFNKCEDVFERLAYILGKKDKQQ